MTWTTACPDWEDRILGGRSLVPCSPLFPGEAEIALTVFTALKVVDMPMVPGPDGMRFQTFGEVCRPWVFDFVAAIFGAYDAESGRRLINEFLLLISKKNGKSTIAAGIMITALVLNWRHSAELSILAPTIEVAKNSADPAMKMVQRDPALFEILKPIPHQRAIEHRTTSSVLKIIAADDEVAAGSKAGFVLVDEEWLFGKSPKAENMMLEATGGLISRPEGFVIKLSTQSDEPPAGIWKDDLQRFRDIRDGRLQAPRSLGVLYEFPERMIKDGSYKDPSNWGITNPNLDASVSREVLLDKFQKAQQGGTKSLVGFFAKHMNVEPGMGQRSDGWPGAEYWKKQDDQSIDLDAIIARCEVVIVGLDGGGMDDLYGLYVLGREKIEVEAEEEEKDGKKVRKPTKRWLGWGHAWCHNSVLDRRKSIATVLLDLEKAGDLTIVDDELADISDIVDIIAQVKSAGVLCCVAADPAGLGEMIDALADIGVTQENKEKGWNYIIGAPQGYGMMTAIKTAERKLVNGTLIHANQPLMDWAVSNLKIEPTATAIRATKINAGDKKIDPAMAMFNTVSVMQQNPKAIASVYERRGLLIL